MLIQQFIRFSIIGAIGFIIDVTSLYLAMHFLGLGLYSGRLFSYIIAASCTWALNRLFTFDSHPDDKKIKQWGKFLLINTLGGSVNYLTYALLVSQFNLFNTYPALAVALGTIPSLIINFSASRKWIFTQQNS